MSAEHSDPKKFAEWFEQDYFRRERPFRTLRRRLVWGAAAVSVLLLAGTLWPKAHVVYQAGPLSPAHTAFKDNCAACHTEAFVTAQRLLPHHADVRSTPDSACLHCHKAGEHDPHQTRNSGEHGMASDCASCHHDHRGGVGFTRIDEKFCIDCHGQLVVKDGDRRFAEKVTSFDRDHPEFGAWRNVEKLVDPGTLKFNHKFHMTLAADLKDEVKKSPTKFGPLAEHLERLQEQNCAYCHQPDNDRRYMQPIRYQNHCAGCHVLNVPPAGEWTKEDIKTWAAAPLPHPARGESAAEVRGMLLQRFWKWLGAPPAAPGIRPPFLDRPLASLTEAQRTDAKKLVAETERGLFAATSPEEIDKQARDWLQKATDPRVAEMEKPLFRLAGGCVHCHTKEEKDSPDGLPVIKPVLLRGRWNEIADFPAEKFGPRNAEKRSDSEQAARDRWFPYARFHHEPHRMMECTACHKDALTSTKTSDVLMPTRDDCRKCHGPSTSGVRADCLECHSYHDRNRETLGLQGTLSFEAFLGATKPGAGPPKK